MTELYFGEWLPDLGSLNNPGSLTVKNCIPEGRGYAAIGSQTAFTTALDNYCRGAIATQRTVDNSIRSFAGDETKLYLMDGSVSSSWEDVSRPIGYTLGEAEYWSFVRFGDRVIAVSQNMPSQSYNLEEGGAFKWLHSSSPKAKCCAVIRDFLVFGSTWDSTDQLKRARVRWAGIGSATDWNVSATTQADYQDLQDVYGGVNAIAGGEVGYIFQERAITRMSYVGSPAIFQFDPVEINKGTKAGRSVVQVGGLVYYLGIDGFYVFDGVQSTAIGELKIDEAFFADLDEDHYHRIVGVSDPKKKIIYWAYPGAGNSNGAPNRILAFNYAEGSATRWTLIEQEVEILWNGINPEFSLEDLDTISTNIDLLPSSLDSVDYMGGEEFVGAFNLTHYATKFNGSALTAVIETAESNFSSPLRTIITRIRPMIEGATTITAEIGTRNNLADAVSYTSAISPQSNGSIACRSNARYTRVRFNVTGDFSNAVGAYIEQYAQGGMR